MPVQVYREYFGDRSAMTKGKASIEPLAYSTHLYTECDIAKDLGLTLGQYQALPRKERKTWIFHRVLAVEKEKHQIEVSKAKAQRDAANRPKPARQIARG